LDERNNGLTL